jgi:hypothetical protein
MRPMDTGTSGTCFQLDRRSAWGGELFLFFSIEVMMFERLPCFPIVRRIFMD